MNINLVTDAPKHNLALMKISAHHKDCGDGVWLNGVGCFDLTYGSWLFKNSPKSPCDIEGGPAINPALRHIYENWKPDYDLYGLDFSLGYTWAYCPRRCPFCIVPKQQNPKDHYSIWSFHDPRFKKICLLNNNTFSDPQWKETFEEIWDADLSVVDENGYDLRLLDDEKAKAIKRTKFSGYVHFAWDQISDEPLITQGLELLKKYKIHSRIYVLIGFNTTQEQDLYRCQKIIDHRQDPYIMPFNQSKKEKKFKRFIDSFMWRRYKTIEDGWENYKP